MSSRIQFSVPTATLRAYKRDRSHSGGFLDAISAADADIELFDPHPHAPDIALVTEILDQLDITVGTVHGGHLQPLLDGDDGISQLLTQVRHLHLASVIDQTPERSLTPDVSTHHAPRFWTDSDVDIADKRRMFLSTLDRALPRLEPDERRNHPTDAFSGTLITAAVCLENVAPRGPYEYLLVTPADVRQLQRTASDLGVQDSLTFTCDVGHTDCPHEMLRAMDDIRNVHLHSTAEFDTPVAAEIREQYEIPSGQPIGRDDRPGVAHHLPPHIGDLELRAVLDTLDDIGYDGPLTVELYEPYRTGPVVKSTVDTLNTVL